MPLIKNTRTQAHKVHKDLRAVNNWGPVEGTDTEGFLVQRSLL